MSLGGQWRLIRHYLSLSNLNAEMEKLLQRVKPSAAQTDSLMQRFEKAIAVRLMHDGKHVEVNKAGAIKIASVEQDSKESLQEDSKEALQKEIKKPVQNEKPLEASAGLEVASNITDISMEGLLRGLRRKKDLHFGKIQELGWKSSKPVVTKTAIQSRTAYVVSALGAASTHASRARRAHDLLAHLALYPEARAPALKALAVVGWRGRPRGRGVAVLALDGGGVRGLLALETLRALQAAARRPLGELFDLIVGVSTGAIIAAALAQGASLDAAAELYRTLARDMFGNTSRLGGASRLVWTHAYYDTRAWERLLRAHLGDLTLAQCNRRAGPRLALVSCVVAGGAPLCPFVFRTYECGGEGGARGTARARVWHAVRASAAAPTYFDEFSLEGLVHQDGGILANNPAGLALREARVLFGRAALARGTLVSVGTGRAPAPPTAPAGTSWKDKFDAILQSATDTEGVHRVLSEALPVDTYYRLNPPLLAPVAMDEVAPERLHAMLDDANAYIRRNQGKVDRLAARLTRPRTVLQRAGDYLHTKAVIHGLARPDTRH